MELKTMLKQYFLKYTAISSESKAGEGTVPSTEGQRRLAELLADDLMALGLSNVEVSKHAVVTGYLPPRLPEGHAPVPTVGWCCHLDTVNVNLSPEIHPVFIECYQGGDICQNPEKGIFIRVEDHPELKRYLGDDLLVSDGTSVLGADNKAAIANVMTMLTVLRQNPDIPHGKICVAFVPDEEIGLLGAKSMDPAKFPVDFAYTIDCCERGELVFETFNAGSAVLRITGVSSHPMSSKNHLVNPIMAAVDFINLLDRAETPEHTEKTEGFIWVTGMKSDVLNAEIQMCIRDHDRKKYEDKKEYLKRAADLIRLRHPRATIELTVSDTYGNIRDAVTAENRACIDLLYKGMEALDIEPKVIAMRGGTDGSFLSTKGILTPNYFTGAHNFHSVCEFLPMSAFEDSCRLTLKLVELAANTEKC